MDCWVVRFQPLCATPSGRKAVTRHQHPPFIDASCRREPDLESVRPSISALCRERFFAPRLKVEAVAVYLTKVGRYPGSTVRGYRVVAVLQVTGKFKTHESAAAWYRKRGLTLPSNCLVDGNPPLAAHHTEDPEADVIEWDGKYQGRVRDYPMLLVTKPLFVELRNPPVLTPAQVIVALGEIPPRTPVTYAQERVERLLALAGIPLKFSPLKQEELEDMASVENTEPVSIARPPAPPRLNMPSRAGGCGPARAPTPRARKRGC